ncbi:MAG: 50S ribosomal protein L4 [bacterium]|nr:50S ribosomal protein L4 [bacterium]
MSPAKTTPASLSAKLTIDVYDVAGKKVGVSAVPTSIAEAKVNPDLIAQAVRMMLNNQHQGTAHTKTRGEVRGSTRKLFKQKGTGRARAGAASAPHRVGGGVVFGPRAFKKRLELPKKMARAALLGALHAKIAEGAVVAIRGLEAMPPKTKHAAVFLRNLKKQGLVHEPTILVVKDRHENLLRASRNIPNLRLLPIQSLSTLNVVGARSMLVLEGAFGGFHAK